MSVRIKAENHDQDEVVPVVDTVDSMDVDNLDIVDSDEDDHKDDGDEVARVIDVYLSPALASQMYLLQFPLQFQPIGPPQAARIKPRHGMIELDQEIPSNIEHDGSFRLSHRTLASHTIPVSTHLAIGKLIDQDGTENKALHLVPLRNITQMRPTFTHVDEASEPYANAAGQGEEEEEKILEKKPLMFQKKESERAANARRSSWAYKKASVESETWQPLQVEFEDSDTYNNLIQKIVCPSPTNNILDVESTASWGADEGPNNAFVKTLNYMNSMNHHADDSTFATGDEANLLKNVVTHLVSQLRMGGPIPYSILKSSLPQSVQEKTILKAIRYCAVMVRGNFLLNSRFLGLSAPLADVRNFTLFLLQVQPYIHRARLDKVFESYEDVTSFSIFHVLQKVGKKTQHGWTLRIGGDVTFVKNFPAETALHMHYWEKQALRYQGYLDLYIKNPQAS